VLPVLVAAHFSPGAGRACAGRLWPHSELAWGLFWTRNGRDRSTDEIRDAEAGKKTIAGHGLTPHVDRGVFSITDVIAILQKHESCYRSQGAAEGLYLRRCESGRVVARGKLVNSGFVQSIDTHWRDKLLPRNTAVFEHGIWVSVRWLG
jgi:hypothetical protein